MACFYYIFSKSTNSEDLNWYNFFLIKFLVWFLLFSLGNDLYFQKNSISNPLRVYKIWPNVHPSALCEGAQSSWVNMVNNRQKDLYFWLWNQLLWIQHKLCFIFFIYSLGTDKANRGICDCLGLLLKILLGPIGWVGIDIYHFKNSPFSESV